MVMGLGYDLPRTLVIKRRFRWTLEVTPSTGGAGPSNLTAVKIAPVYVRVAARPQLTFEELELNFLNERAYYSGKPSWEPLTTTILDCHVPGSNEQSAAYNINQWAQSVYRYAKPDISGAMGDPGKEFKADTMILRMFDGVGGECEKWTLYGVWPQTVNWGELDYTNNDAADIEVTFRFDNAEQVLTATNGGKSLGNSKPNLAADPKYSGTGSSGQDNTV